MPGPGPSQSNVELADTELQNLLKEAENRLRSQERTTQGDLALLPQPNDSRESGSEGVKYVHLSDHVSCAQDKITHALTPATESQTHLWIMVFDPMSANGMRLQRHMLCQPLNLCNGPGRVHLSAHKSQLRKARCSPR